jgi:hypothetical protein
MVYSASSRAPSRLFRVARFATACQHWFGRPPRSRRWRQPQHRSRSAGQPSRTPRTLRAKSSPKPAWMAIVRKSNECMHIPRKIWAVLASVAINVGLPFINGVMLGALRSPIPHDLFLTRSRSRA